MENISNKMEPAVPPVGENLKLLRTARKLSLGELAKLSGISKTMLSQIESGKVNPTLVTLWKVANALAVELPELISGRRHEPDFFTRLTASEQARITSDDGRTTFRILSAPGLPDALEMYHLTMEPGAIHRSAPHEAGWREMVLVTSGSVKITSGEHSSLLHEGDFLAYRGDQEHCIENCGSSIASLHMTDINVKR